MNMKENKEAGISQNDSKKADEVFNYLKDISKDKCVIVVSHNEKIKNYADKVIYLEKGVLKDED